MSTLSVEVPDTFKLLHNEEDVLTRVKELGAAITPWAEQVYRRTGKDLMVVPILRGAVLFFADLCRAIDHSVEFHPIRAQHCQVGVDGAFLEDVNVYLDEISVAGRSVLLVDDICDSGKTLMKISVALSDRKAREVRSAVIVHRIIDDPLFTPNFIGFSYSGDEWFVGYGMENSERFRNLGSLYITSPESSDKDSP